MADVAGLNIVLGAKVDQLKAGLNVAQRELAETAIAANKVDSSLAKSSGTVNKSTKDFTALSRVIQDLPFGFIGIQNNITQLLPAAGALGLVISSVTAAITFAQVGTSAWTRGLTGNKKQVDENRIAVNEYAAAMQKLYEQAGKQISQVSQMVAALTSENTTLSQRKKLLEDLVGINNTYFAGLRLEHGEVVGLAEAYEKYAENIFLLAKAKGAAQQVELLSTKLVGLTDNINNLTNQLSGANRELTFADAARGIDAIKKDFEELNKILKSDLITLQDFQLISRLTGLSENQVNDVLFKRRQLRTEEKRTLAQIADLSKFIALNDLSSIVGNVNPEKAKKAGISLLDQLRKGLHLLKPEPLDVPIAYKPVIPRDFDVDATNRAILKAQIEALVAGSPILSLPIGFEFMGDEERKKLFADLQSDIKATGEIISTFLVPAFDAAFSALENGESVFASVGNALQQLIGKLIRAAAEAAVLTLIMNALFPGSGFSFGSIFSQLSGLPRFAEGGVVSKPTLGLFGEAGPEVVFPLDKINQYLRPQVMGGGTLEHRISGNDLVLWLRAADNQYKRKY